MADNILDKASSEMFDKEFKKLIAEAKAKKDKEVQDGDHK